MARKPFKLRSGNSTSFKMMGSSPLHIDDSGGGHWKQHGSATSAGEMEFDQGMWMPPQNVDVRSLTAPNLYDKTKKQVWNELKEGKISKDDFIKYQENYYKPNEPDMSGDFGGAPKALLDIMTMAIPGANLTKLKHLSKLKNIKTPSWLNKKLFSDKSFNVGGKTVTVKSGSVGSTTGDLLRGTGVALEGQSIKKDYEKKRKQGKGWLRSLGEATHDNTIGFVSDINDIVGTHTGWWKPQSGIASGNYLWGGERRTMVEKAYDEALPGSEYDDKTSTIIDKETGKRVKTKRPDVIQSKIDQIDWDKIRSYTPF